MLVQRDISVEQLSQLADGGYVFALVDACNHHELVMSKAYEELGESKAICLFKGTYMEGYDAVAPYLFTVDRALLEWIPDNLEKTTWGVFLLTKGTREELRAHLQRFFMVTLPDGRKSFFSYYDPRVLKAYLPTCEPAELQQFFGPVRGFGIADPEEPKILILEYSPQQPLQLFTQLSGLWPIRLEQFHALGNLSKEHFVKRTVSHARECFPDLWLSLGNQGLYDYIHYGVERAASYGITLQNEVRAYIDLMCGFGKDFDQNNRYSWATAILRDSSISPPTEKLRRIYDVVRRLAQSGDR